jgi:hypothetical protein
MVDSVRNENQGGIKEKMSKGKKQLTKLNDKKSETKYFQNEVNHD